MTQVSSHLKSPPQQRRTETILQVIAVIGYGDETWVPAQPWNRGTCEVGMGVSHNVQH